MSKVCVVIQAYNEARQIQECIMNAREVADSIVVIDTESTDDTATLARESGADVYSFPYTRYVEPARDFAIEKASSEWVFLLDADERFSPELRDELAALPLSGSSDGRDGLITHYKVPRKELFGRKLWLRHGGWWPNYQTRLIKKVAFRSWPHAIHSTPEVAGECGLLSHPLLHYSKNDYYRMVEKTTIFEDLESDLLAAAGRHASVPVFFRKFAGEFYRRMIRNMGFMDGAVGIVESMYQAFSKTITYIYVYEKKKRRPI